MSEPVKIALIFDGTDLMRVVTAGVPVEYVTVDRDVEGIEEERCVIFDGHEAYVRHHTAEFTLEGCALAMEAFDAVDAALCLPAYRESIGAKPFCFPGDLVDHAVFGRGKVEEAGPAGVRVMFDVLRETVPFADLSAVPGIYTAEGLIERYGKWGEHPVYTDHMWRRDTKTRLGYFEWLAEKLTRELPSFAPDQPAAAPLAERQKLREGQDLLQRHAPSLLMAAKEFIITVRYRSPLYDQPEFCALVAACADAEGFPSTRYRVLPTPCPADGGWRIWDRDVARVASTRPGRAEAEAECARLNAQNEAEKGVAS